MRTSNPVVRLLHWLVDALLAALWGGLCVVFWVGAWLLVSRLFNLGPYFEFALMIIASYLAPAVAAAGVICGPLLDRIDGRATLLQGLVALAAGTVLAWYIVQPGVQVDALIAISIAPAEAIVLSSIGTRLLGLQADRWLARLVAASLLPLTYLGFIAWIVRLLPSRLHDLAGLDRDLAIFLIWAGSLAMLGPVCFPPSLYGADADHN